MQLDYCRRWFIGYYENKYTVYYISASHLFVVLFVCLFPPKHKYVQIFFFGTNHYSCFFKLAERHHLSTTEVPPGIHVRRKMKKKINPKTKVCNASLHHLHTSKITRAYISCFLRH